MLAGKATLAGIVILAGAHTCRELCGGSAPHSIRPTPIVNRSLRAFTSFARRRTATSGSTAIPSRSSRNDGVLVFDTNGTPSAAAAVLAEIRTLTPNRSATSSTRTGIGITGTAPRSTAAFPDVKVIAHEKTRAMMAGPAIEFNGRASSRSCPDTSPARAADREGGSRDAAAARDCRGSRRRWPTGGFFSIRRTACSTRCRT